MPKKPNPPKVKITGNTKRKGEGQLYQINNRALSFGKQTHFY